MHNVKITKIVLKNFIGIRNGLGKTELNLDISKLGDKNIICILGDNGTGKSTLSSVLHPLPGTTDKRNKFIIEDKEGLKKIYYDRSDGCKYECKLVYSPSKTGHTTKGFIKKISKDGESVELNPNGNISSYKDIIFDELGVSDAILKLANQNDVCKGHVDMTSTERKVNMSTFLPEDIYSHHFAVVDKIYKEMKTRINVLVDAIGKMHDDETIKTNLEKITNDINTLVAKRDKCVGKIKEFETRIDIITKDNVLSRENELIRDIKSDNKSIEKLAEKIKSLYTSSGISAYIDPDLPLSKIPKKIDDVKKIKQDKEITLSIITNTITELKNTRNSISDDIDSRELILKDIMTDLSLGELTKILDEYTERFKYLDSVISKLDTNIRKEDFMIGYDIVSNIRSSIETICDHSNYAVEDLITNDPTFSTGRSKLEELQLKRSDLIHDKEELLQSISDLNKNAELKEILNKRPAACKIDDCPFIKNAQRWVLIEKEIIKYNDSVSKIDSELNSVSKEIEFLAEQAEIYSEISQLWKYIETNLPTINKLPYSDKYSTYEALIKSIKKRGSNLSDCDNFDKFIEILEYQDEYNELKYRKIPNIENEIKILKTQGKIITTSKEELKSLKERFSDIEKQIDSNIIKQSEFKSSISELELIIESMDKFYDKKSEYGEVYDDMILKVDELKSIKSKIDELHTYEEKLKEKKQRLKDIDIALNPLTRERELYKMEQLKIADHKQELAAIEQDMFKCEIVRSSLSIKDDGIPVGALEYFMDAVRTNANALLSGAFNGSLYLEEFIINSKDFIIPYKKNGDSGMDVSFASSSERSFISLCLTLAIMEEIVSSYGIAILDEIDRGFSDSNKYKFIEILGSQIKRVGITQVFMVTHNSSFYEGYNIGYILFPGSTITKIDDDDCIRVG